MIQLCITISDNGMSGKIFGLRKPKIWGIEIDCKLEQPANTESPIDVTLVGIVYVKNRWFAGKQISVSTSLVKGFHLLNNTVNYRARHWWLWNCHTEKIYHHQLM